MTSFLLKRLATFLVAFVSLAATARAQDEPTPVAPKIASLGVFKNGVTVVEESFSVSASGRYSMEIPERALHGAFFIQSDALVSTTASKIKTRPALTEVADLDWTKDFKGKWLRIKISGKEEPIEARVLSSSKANAKPAPNLMRANPYANYPVEPSGANQVLLETRDGETLWLANAASVTDVVVVDGAPETVEREEPRLVFNVQIPDDKQGATVSLFYLSQGLCWAPQYRVELLDDKKLSVEQSAIVINDWGDFDDVPVVLFCGFPQIQFANALSPMLPNVSAQEFFNSLANGNNTGVGLRRENAYMTQAALSNSIMYSRDAVGDDAAFVVPESGIGESVDIYGQSVGKRSLKRGERQMFTVGRAFAEYERRVCWNILDARDVNGRYLNFNERQSQSESLLNVSYGQTTSGEAILNHYNRFTEPWDALAFANPFEFPITTGPGSIVANGRFLGQNSFVWTNPKEDVLLPVTKALSVRVASTENEREFPPSNGVQPKDRAYFIPSLKRDDWGGVVQYYGGTFRVAVVDAQITLTNQRSEESKVVISRQFSGVVDPESFDGFETQPKVVKLGAATAALDAINPRCELQAEIVLKPGEKKIIKFSYQIMLRI